MNRVHFSSASPNWETPQELFDNLNAQFHFTLDPCASESNHKCDKYYTKEQDGLTQDWSGEVVFMNPPYGRDITKWVKKAYDEWLNHNVVTVALLPARTDTRWFHAYIYGNTNIVFLKGRLKFSNSKQSAPFPSMVVVWK